MMRKGDREESVEKGNKRGRERKERERESGNLK